MYSAWHVNEAAERPQAWKVQRTSDVTDELERRKTGGALEKVYPRNRMFVWYRPVLTERNREVRSKN